jgi:hypothetical protein
MPISRLLDFYHDHGLVSSSQRTKIDNGLANVREFILKETEQGEVIA